MHAVTRLLVVALVAGVIMSVPVSHTQAATHCRPSTRDVTTNPNTGLVEVAVAQPSCPGAGTHRQEAETAGTEAGTSPALAPPALIDLCRTKLRSPQPPRTDPIWAGHGDGLIYVRECPFTKDGRSTTTELWQAAAAQAATITPAQLARRALAALRVPKPTFQRSPRGPEGGELPVTWVNLWTWVWTGPTSWRELSRTASVGSVWATVRVAPVHLVLAPGDGGAPVTCTGPGRPWTPHDGSSAPSQGGCGYLYSAVHPKVRATLSIRWSVSWTGSGGTAGTLPLMTTSTSDAFVVQQIQVVN